jgi:hypothetical protein
MTPKQLHIMCDFFLLIPLLGILLSVFFFSNNLEKEIFVIKDILASWKKKPIHILQDSFQKPCEEIGMTDVVTYEWPGTKPGCHCANIKTLSTLGKCNEKELQMGCKSVEEIKPYKARKWKTRFLCASSVKSKTYFELNKVKENEACPYKFKKCGIIDTLGNHLCIPENENCPLNSISFMPTSDDQNVRIDTSNSKITGKIYTNFIVAENQLCVNHIEREFAESEFSLINSKGKYLNGCKTYASLSDGQTYYQDKNFEKMDSYPKSVFYEQNKIFPFVTKNVPTYPSEIKSSVALYASVFTGWKRECDRKEFNQLKNGDIDVEISEIVKSTNDYNFYLIVYSLAFAGLYTMGIILFKYPKILSGSHRIEITNTVMVILIILYVSLFIINICLLYTSDLNLDTIKNSKITSDFFEMMTNNDCSDDFTNSVLKHVTKEYFSYANRYFNIKILSIGSILVSFSFVLILIFVKPSSESRNKRRNYMFKQD